MQSKITAAILPLIPNRTPRRRRPADLSAATADVTGDPAGRAGAPAGDATDSRGFTAEWERFTADSLPDPLAAVPRRVHLDRRFHERRGEWARTLPNASSSVPQMGNT